MLAGSHPHLALETWQAVAGGRCWLISNEDEEKVAENSLKPCAGLQRSSRSDSVLSLLPTPGPVGGEKVSQAAGLSPVLHPICPGWVSLRRPESRLPEPLPSPSGALAADGHLLRMGAHGPGVPQANPSLASPKQRRSPRTRGRPRRRNTESRLSPAPRRQSCRWRSRWRSRLPRGTRLWGSATARGRNAPG